MWRLLVLGMSLCLCSCEVSIKRETVQERNEGIASKLKVITLDDGVQCVVYIDRGGLSCNWSK